MTASGAIATIATQIAGKGFSALFGELLKQSFKDPKSDRSFTNSKFEQYFSSTFERCVKVKTLLNRDTPANLLQTYVNIVFRAKSPKGEDILIDDYQLIERISTERRLIIIGTAGGGKTVFMRYLWISIFSNPENRVPIYIELRRLNDLTSVDLVAFVTHTCFDSSTDSAVSHIRKLLSDGRIVFILDGFDEVSIDHRLRVERQIIEVSRKYPKTAVVVSGRPDDKLDAWQDFSKHYVQPLNKTQVIDLVEKVDFDDMVRSKFIIAIKRDLYEKHQSFLSSPLLATMMLLTFRYYAEIPNKIHVFYDLAFDTLFSMHDALKEAFNRKKYTGYPIDVFKRRLACLCLVSYIDQKFEFSDAEIREYICRSARIDNAKVATDDFLQDLLESVCIMQRDGLNITFTHRSFQEYFTSCCLSNFTEDKLRLLIPKLARRRSDNVLTMLFDMIRDMVEKVYVIPLILQQSKIFDQFAKDFSGLKTLQALQLRILIYVDNINRKEVSTGNGTSDDELADFRRVAQAFYPNLFKIGAKKINKFISKDIGMYESFPLFQRWNEIQPAAFILESETDGPTLYYQKGSSNRKKMSKEDAEQAARWFLQTGHYDYLRALVDKYISTARIIPRDFQKRTRETSEILGIIGL